MRRFKIYFLSFALLTLFGCKKQKFESKEVVDSVLAINDLTPSLVGKWRLVEYNVRLVNQFDCEVVGSNTYSTDVTGENMIIEVFSTGEIHGIKDDTITSTWLVTSQNCDSDQCNYKLNGGNVSMIFMRLNSNQIIEDCVIGDTITIKNPFVNLNSQSGQIKAYSTTQYFVKIE